MYLKVKILDEGLDPPTYQHPGDAGLDLRARSAFTLHAGGGRALIATGVSVELPEGHVGLVCPRSGMAVAHGVTVLNAPGVIDAGYRGEIQVALINLDRAMDFAIERGDRIAQLLVIAMATPTLELVQSLAESERGTTGFGDSGKS